MNHAEEIAIAIQHFRNSNNAMRIVKVVNAMRHEGFNDEQINALVLVVARAIFSEPKETTE
jgi:alkylhydroperoxidase family enzyme